MAAVSQLYVELRANIAPYTAGLTSAAARTRAFGAEVKGAGADLSTLEKRGGSTAASLEKVGLVVGGAMVAGLAYGVVKAVELEREMYNVATISSEVADHMGEYTDAVVKMSTQLPQSATTLAQGLYDIVSSGFDGADALTVLQAAAASASAGLTDTATSARAITAVLNAYGMSASQATDVSDILFETVNKGVVTYEELANVTGMYIATAAAAKVSVQDADAALAAMTLSGENAHTASTALNQLFNTMLKPTDALAEAFHQMGFQSGAAALATLGLHGTVVALSKSQGTAADTAVKLFTNVRAARGYLALTAAEGKNYDSTFDAIANTVNRADAAHKALEQQQKSSAYQMTILKNDATAFAIGLGEAVLPALHAVVGAGTEFADFLNAIPGPLKDVIGLLGGVSGAGLLVLAAFLKLSGPIRAFRTSMDELALTGSRLPTALKATTLTLGGLGIALTAATAIYGLYTSAKQRAKDMTNDFVQALQAEQQGTTGAVQTSIVDKLVNSGDKDLLDQLGVSVKLYTDAVTGGAGAQGKFSAAVKAGAEQYDASNKTFGEGSIKAGKLTSDVQSLAGAYDAAKHNTDQQTDAQKKLNAATDSGKVSMGALASQTQVDKNGTAELTDQQTAMNKAYSEFEDIAGAVTSSLARLDTNAFGDAVDASTTKAGLSMSALMKNMRESAQQQKQWQDDLANVAQRGGQEFADALQAMGTKGVNLTHQLAVGSNAQLDQVKAGFASLAPATQQSLDAFTRELDKQLQDQQDWSNNLAKLALMGRDDLVQEFQTLGPSAASLLGQAVNATKGQLDALSAAVGHGMSLTGANFQNGLNLLSAIAAAGGKATVQSLARQFKVGVPAMVSQLQEIRDAITDLPTRHVIQLLIDDGTDWDALRKELTAHEYALQAGLNAHHLRIVGQENADGAVYFADGAHVAQIAPPGAMRIWAEPETGGEAYIPLASSKRTRSRAILDTVAGVFGGTVSYQADGGVVTAVRQPAAAGATVNNFHTTLQVMGNVYGDADLKRRTEDLMDRRDKELTAAVRAAR